MPLQRHVLDLKRTQRGLKPHTAGASSDKRLCPGDLGSVTARDSGGTCGISRSYFFMLQLDEVSHCTDVVISCWDIWTACTFLTLFTSLKKTQSEQPTPTSGRSRSHSTSSTSSNRSFFPKSMQFSSARHWRCLG